MDKVTLPVTTLMRLQYTDSKGQTTERIVDIKQFDANDADGNFKGFCHLRRRIRSFKLARVAEAVDVATGEVLAGDALPAYLLALYNEAPRTMLRHWLDDHRPIVDVLTYVGYCDGAMIAIERETIVTWILQHAEIDDTAYKLAHELVKTWPIPERSDMMRAAMLINQHMPEYKDIILMQARRVAKADRLFHENEQTALGLLEMIFQASES